MHWTWVHLQLPDTPGCSLTLLLCKSLTGSAGASFGSAVWVGHLSRAAEVGMLRATPLRPLWK